MKEEVFKEHLGRASVKSIIRTAKERRPGALGFAEALMLAYNNKNKYRLSLRTLYGGKGVEIETDEIDPADEGDIGSTGNAGIKNTQVESGE